MRSKGNYYEGLAKNYLESIGYRVVERNYYFGHKEIDVICIKGKVLLFVEVKYRKNREDFDPFRAINRVKIESMKECANDFLSKHEEYGDCYGRFDAIFVIGHESKKEEIVHIENI